MKQINVIGAGGHAKVVIATAHALGYEVKNIFDQDITKIGKKIWGISILNEDRIPDGLENVVIAIGNNRIRKQNAEALRPRVKFISLIHPSACVHESVKLGEGTVIFAGSVIQPDTVLGAHCIVNTSASIDHDNQIGNFVHVAPGTRLAGGIRLEEGVFCGINSAIIPLKTIGAWATIGAGSVVIRDVPTQETVIGVPAKSIH